MSIRRTYHAVEIDHASLCPVVDVHANIENRNRDAVVRDIETALQGLEMPSGVTIEVLREAPPWP